MFLQVIGNIVKSYYSDFLPFWKWKIPVETKKTKHRYHQIHSICRDSQYILGGLAALIAVSVEQSRQLFITAVFRNGLPIFLMDIFAIIILGYLLGLKRFPANYISLVIIKTFIVLKENFKSVSVNNVGVKLLAHSRFGGSWAVVTASPQITRRVSVLPIDDDSYLRKTGIAVACVVAFWIVSKSNVGISKYKTTVLISQTIATSVAALLLLSTLAFDAIPGIKENHRKLCELWTVFAVTTLILALAFLFDHLRTTLWGKRKRTNSNFKLRVEWEAFIFILAFSITVRFAVFNYYSYIPVIHKKFSAQDVLANKTTCLLEWCVPPDVLNAVYAFSSRVYEIVDRVIRTNAGFQLFQ